MIYLKEGQIPLNFAYNDEIIQEGNSKYQLSFKFPTNNPLWEELVEETLLLADDLHGEQEFIIFEVEKHHAYITVYANQVATLLNNYSITELSVNNASGDRVMRSLVSSIIREHKFTFSSDIANTHSLNLKNVTVANALFKDKHSIIGQWGGDLIRDKYDIRLLSNGGTNKEALFMYKKNLKSYQQKKSIKDLRTRIHFTKTINSQKEGEKDKVIAVTVDSPLISKYKNIYEGNLDVSDQDVTDEATLRKYGEQYFKTTLCDVIEENIEISVLGTPDEPVQIFDTVTIFYEKYNLDVKKKITKYTYAPMGRKLKTIGFGKIQSNLGTTLATMVDNAIEEKAETMLDAFKLQKNLAQLLKLDRKGIEDKLVELEEKSKGALEVKKALFEADGTIPDVVKAKILDAVEGDIGRLKTIITEAELIKAIQAKLNYADIKNALIDKAFINQIISDEKFTQQFEDGQVTTQNIFTKLKDSIKSNISKEFVTKDGVRKLVNDLTIDADGIRQITQQESSKVFETKKSQLQGVNSYIHKKYSDYPDGRNMSDNSTLKYIGIYTGDKQQAPTNASEYSWTKIKVDGKLYKAYSNSLNGTDFTLVEPDENAKLFAKNRPRVNIVNDNDISDIWQANMFLSFKPNTKYTLTARAKGNSNKLWAYFRNNRTSEEYSWGQLEFRGLETKSITFTTTNDVDDVLFKFVLVPEDEDWTGIQIDWFTIYEGDKRYTDYPVDEPAQYHKYRYFGYVFKEGEPVASDFEWFDLQQTSIANDKYTHIVYSDNADGSNFGREPKKYMGVARTTSPAQPTDKTAYKWFKMKGEDGRDGVDGKSINRNYIVDSDKLTNINSGGTNWEKTVENGTLVFTKVRATESTGIWTQIMPILKDNFQNEVLTWSVDVKASKNISFNNVGQETNGFKGRVDITTQWQRISHTFTNRYTQHYAFVLYQMIGTCSPGDKVYIRLPKLEKGNVATEWSPAYEDLRGRDGVSNYIHRKYSDYSNGANMSDNSNLKYIGIYTGTSPTPPTTASSYLWSKIKGEDGANGVPGAKGADGRTPYFHTAYSNSPTGDRDFSTTNSNDKLYIGTYSDFEVADSNDYRRYKWVKIKGENGRNGTDGHTLTANLRLEGGYLNNVTNDVKAYLDVFYDGQKITDGFNARVKFKGGIQNTWSNFWDAKVDNTGFLTNVSWGNKEQPYPIALELIALVTYKNLNTVANARLDNLPDVRLINETVKKYKTFESTLEGFTSVVGEIDTKVFSKSYFKNNLNSEDVEKTGNDLYFNTKENLVANEYYTILADLDNVPANQQAYIYSASDGGDKKTIQNGLNYWVVKYTTNQTRINLYPLGTNTKVKNVRIYKGDFRIKKDDERENLYSSSATDSGDKFIHLNLIKNKINGNVYTVKFDASGYSYGDRWDIYNRIGYDENNLTQILKSKDNEFTFTINDNTTADRMYIRMKLVGNTTISNVEIYDVSTEYVKNSQVSKLESSIKQTKDEIDLKVSKDNVINSINISAEGTRIKGDLIADYLYGKTIEGAVIQGNSKIKIGKHGYMIPAGDGLRFCLPEKPDANKGVGVQMLGNYGRDGDTAYGFYLYVDPNFDTTEVAATNSYLMTVTGYISTRGVNNLKFQNYSDNSTAIGVWDKNVSLLFDRTKNDIYYEWNGKIYSIWQMVDRFYSTTSDARLKKDIRPCAYKALDLINDFKFKSFNWEHREQLEKKPFTEIGLIAQDVEKINKNFVTMAGEYKTLNQFNLLTYSLKAIQELSQENTNLKSQIKEMNERLTKLEDKINGNI
nr:MAG TPA: Neck appendage protein [Caudoviricetes sp.]